jgi:hypothetical protein
VLRDDVVQHRAAGIPRCVSGNRWRHTSPHRQQGENGRARSCPPIYCLFVQYTSKKLARGCGGNRRDAPLCRSSHAALSARWRWQNSVCFSFYVAAVVKPLCGCFSPLHSLGAGSHRTKQSGDFLWCPDLASPMTFSPCRCTHLSPQSRYAFRRQPQGLWEVTPPIRRLVWQARKNNGSPPPALRHRRASEPLPRFHLFDNRPHG